MKIKFLFFILLAVSCPSFAKEKVALIFGVTGQDGSYLSELLLEKGYIVHGVKRRSSSFNTERVNHLYKDRHDNFNCHFWLHYGDVTDLGNIVRLIQEIQPDEIYNLAAQSHVKVSFEKPIYTAHATALGALNILEAIRVLGKADTTKFYQASTSEMFGKVQEVPQKETTPFYPRSPYGVAKLYAHWITKNYREAYGIFACSGILFNHESVRRGETFVTRKIARGVAHIKKGLEDAIYLGNLDARRDWGHARDYVQAMWLMLQHDTPDDYVTATGQAHSIREFVEQAFKCVGIEIVWRGKGINEKGHHKHTDQILVHVDSRYFRPTEVEALIGNAEKIKRVLGWQPTTSFEDLVKEMVEYELNNL